jgi:hypothetical protein
MFYSARHKKIINLGNLINADHADDLSYVILWMRGGDTVTLHDAEARGCLDLLADRLHQSGDRQGGSALRNLVRAVEQQQFVGATAGAR